MPIILTMTEEIHGITMDIDGCAKPWSALHQLFKKLKEDEAYDSRMATHSSAAPLEHQKHNL